MWLHQLYVADSVVGELNVINIIFFPLLAVWAAAPVYSLSVLYCGLVNGADLIPGIPNTYKSQPKNLTKCVCILRKDGNVVIRML